MRKKIVLACHNVGQRNYSTLRKRISVRMELKKYCNALQRTYIHRETN